MHTFQHSITRASRQPASMGRALLAAAFLGLAACAPEEDTPEVAQADDALGHVDFQADCAQPARVAVDEALTMTHHMMYEQARDRFESLVAEHPDCAMGYWGVATTLFQPLWATRPSEDDLQRGWDTAREAAERADTEREALLIEATTAFFREPEAADYSTRQQRWADAIQAAFEAQSTDNDIAAFYALSLLAQAQGADDPHPLHDEAETILRAVHERAPRHPGAIHYIIHGDDIEGRAERNLDIVASYGEIAPSVPHALHMPSHIYVRLGDWPAVIHWNQRSSEAALAHPAGEHVSHHYPHAQDYIIYGYLQRGEDRQAQRAYEETLAEEGWQPTAISAFHRATIPARIAVERRDWERAAALEPRTPEALPWDAPVGLWAQSQTWLARGLGAVHGDNLEAAERALQQVAALRSAAEEADEAMMASYIGIEERILDGWLAYARGEEADAIDALQAAVDQEARIEKHPITPGALLPPNEALGDLLMALDRPADALAAYRRSEAVWPSRYNTLLGAARAADAAGDEAAAADWYGRLLEVAPEAERASIEEARERAGA